MTDTYDEKIRKAQERLDALEDAKESHTKRARKKAQRDFEREQKAKGLFKYTGIWADAYESEHQGRGASGMVAYCTIWAKDLADARAQAKEGIREEVKDDLFRRQTRTRYCDAVVLAKHLHPVHEHRNVYDDDDDEDDDE
jgi:hypothetical protein